MATSKQTPENSSDLVSLILEDHVLLKELIEVLKDSDRSFEDREEAFAEFAPLLVMHAKPEEETLYMAMKDHEDMREEGFEGDVEHQLADQMLEEAKRTDDRDLWGARVKVLAELVEHHIKEEETEMLPNFKKNVDLETRVLLGEDFLMMKEDLLSEGGDDAPPEALLKKEDFKPELRY